MNQVLRVSLSGILALAVISSVAWPDDAELSRTTHVYKTVGDIEIHADVYRAEDGNAQPVIVWYHGGALLMGSRASVPRQLLDLARSNGFVLVSMDYRLAPETPLPEIVADVKDGVAWVREKGPELFAADPDRLVVAGASAGGYLALTSGFVARPRPTAIVSYWGFGDVDGDWTTKPSEAYRKGKLVDRDAAWSAVGKHPLTNTNRENGAGRSRLFLHLKQTGGWLKAVSGLDPQSKADRGKLDRLCPVRNVTSEYPPTLLLHGTADIDVPVEQSREFARALDQKDVPFELITIEGGGHSLWGGDRAKIEQAFSRSQEYIREQLTKSSESR